MIAQSLTVNPFPNSFLKCHRPNPGFLSPSVSLNVSRWNEAMSMRLSRERTVGTTVLASKEQSSSYNSEKKRKVVEHICLLKAKKDLSEEEENDMLDYLYTSQYQMGGIVAISLGRISNENVENYTHGVFMRFQRKEQLVKFYENPFYSKVLKEHVMPYCHGLMNVDYETEVEDDILPIFRKGEDFNFGVEFVLLISFIQSAFGGPAEDALESLKRLTAEFPSLIVQSTQGSNFNLSSEIYTHAVVIRLRSVEAFEMFVGSSDYKEMWSNKFQPIIRTQLPVHFSVDPVGTEIM
ncbi:hypothetical protein KPL70_003846 [Citrus sinensis]|uniref:Stress-response A/B barrel domain-containing protein n=1 Tax=Citrus clementina TaxID=85681 RepID=V4UEW7_CITCL|nr:uncharacterized protein LOC18051008 [Citrus x clementina]XP_006469666.1 uncharacterized protein LOC102629349 isoform X2 [Citrus sinensis]ESR60826.1 hypothetical protein CICLE_v10016122mg [Citrus x clementina]KAH9744818.1 hypothetical protein KPL70_003846 [Citrus sinensis]